MATSRICSIEGCNKPARGHGWCSAHYERWRHHGDPLAGRTPVGAAQKFLEEVVLNVTDKRACVSWPYATTSYGYGQITVDGEHRGVHRLVCEMVHGAPPSTAHEAAHSCGNGHLGCVNPHHLSWKTPAENIADQLVHGTRARGKKLPQTKLTEAQVIKIRSLKGRVSQKKIAAVFKIDQSTVSDVMTGRSWGWLNSS